MKEVLRVMMEIPGERGKDRQEKASGAVGQVKEAFRELFTISRKYTQS